MLFVFGQGLGPVVVAFEWVFRAVLRVDAAVVELVLALRSPVLTKLMTSVTGLGSATAAVVFLALFSLAGWRRDLTVAALSLAVSGVVVVSLMALVERPFPPAPVCVTTGASLAPHPFPSGHAAAVTVFAVVARRSDHLPFGGVSALAAAVAVSRVYRLSRPSASGLDPEGEGRRNINQTTVRTVDTVRNPQRRVKDLNPTLTEAIWKCDSSQNLRLWRGATGVVGRGGAADPHGRTERSGVNSSRPISGRSRGIKFACDSTARFGTCGQDGEASGLVPEVLHLGTHYLSDTLVGVGSVLLARALLARAPANGRLGRLLPDD